MKDYHRGWPLWPEIPFYHMSDMKKCWQASASFTRKQVVESITEFEEVLELIEDAHETSKNNTDNMAYYSWEKMWKDMKVNFDKLAAKLREGG
jgi:hypothetical protein